MLCAAAIGEGCTGRVPRAPLRCHCQPFRLTLTLTLSLTLTLTLTFQVELLSWRSTRDILGDGSIMKVKSGAEGSGYEKPGERDEARGGC